MWYCCSSIASYLFVCFLYCRIHASSNHAYSQKSYNGFLLSPPPTGLMTPRSPTTTSSIGAGFSPFYNYTAPQPLGSISDIDASVEQPSKYRHFNFHHSPTNTIEKMEVILTINGDCKLLFNVFHFSYLVLC